MTVAKLDASGMGRLFVLCAIGCLAAGNAFAASTLVINKYITVQPITVCNTNGSSCAQVNDGAAQIGFLDNKVSPNDDTTDEIISKELVDNQGNGMRVTFLPLAQFNSPTKSGSTQTYQTLNFTTGDSCGTFQSTEFQTLVQQPAIANTSTGGAFPNPTPPFSTKKCAVKNGVLQPTCVPISTNPTTINLFFVNNLQLPGTGNPLQSSPICSGFLAGYGQINGNGIAINSTKVFGLQLLDVIAHEIAHNLSLTHVTTGTTTNLETQGGTRVIPTTLNYPLSTSGLGTLFDSLSNTQTAQVLDPSGFLNPILEVNTMITGPTTPTSNTFNFKVSIPAKNTGAPVSVIAMIFEIPGPPFSNPSFTVTNNPDNLIVVGSPTNGNSGNNAANVICGSSSIKCFEIDILGPPPFGTGPAFGPGGTLSFSLAISSSHPNTTLGDLANATFTYLTSDQFATTSAFTSNKSGLTADSLSPAFNIPAVINNADSFIAFTQTPCTLSTGQCPNTPTTLGEQDMRSHQ